ncbi:hypothetical protein FPZ43_00430 [Mucilaginibacter pallidiroseus]|uniref:Uncharacterized protein n=1 Tax=Mucilaginibacter pallidiroseus TaxID=2599295 RepID=A0A563UHZ7_9SPHI|nr:DUF6702 family protein [Mucilaginibacter pallidiroseus]TWR30985.1 hypothetical protein FPZ43_00430 [Mucilaginibacter pallidiroseus]
MAALLSNSLLYCYILTGLLSLTNPAKTTFHPLHVSTTDISLNPKDNQLEITCTIFTDDFESALEKQFHAKADLNRADMHAAMDVMVKNYVNAHLQIKAGGAAVKPNYLGFEINREAVNVYLESAKINTPKNMEAEVSLLQDLYQDQLNIVHMTVNGTRKSTRLDYPAKKAVQNF